MTSIPNERGDILADDCKPDNVVSGVSWSAIIGGALAAAAVSLILLILGSALGLSSVSPWSRPETIAAFTTKTAIWLIIMQWIASGLGGYLSGRLRIKWTGMHTDEVFFRDTAHGFLAWSLATLFTATIIASSAASVISGGTQAAATVSAGAAASNVSPAASRAEMPLGENGGYYIDNLFRSAKPNPTASLQDTRAETIRILVLGMKNGSVPDADKDYLTQLVSERTGLNQADASRRVDEVINQLNTAKDEAKEKAEAARKTAMHISIFIFLSLLVGAFIASVAAALGGRHRDEY